MKMTVEHHLRESRYFSPPYSETAHIRNFEQYKEMYKRSLEDSEGFWLDMCRTLEWEQFPSIGLKYSWERGSVSHTWFEDGQLNVTINCIDRHLNRHASKPAIVWQGEEDKQTQVIDYQTLYEEVCRFANVLKSLGIEKGDRVCIYMPMVPELIFAALGCARIGAIHSIVFGGFSAEALSHRINDSECQVLVTANYGIRSGKHIPLKSIADEACESSSSIKQVIVLRRTEDHCEMIKGRDLWYHELMDKASLECDPVIMNAEDPLFILYTSGSTGKPKGVVHSQAGYLLHTSLSHRYVFDIQEDDIFWCTADIGWITGHSYVIYGPLANGSTVLMFEGVPTYPDPGRFWQVIDKHAVTKFYTAPTAIRALICHGETWPEQYDLSSLKLLGTVGEPINPETWMWYYEVIGKGKLPIVDTWWQTETGGIMITPLPFSHGTKPGSATKPFFGVEPIIVNDDGSPCDMNEGGALCIQKPWPGIMRTTWGDHESFIKTYFSLYPGLYYTGDGACKDHDGDYWLMGRIDDVVNIAGHRLGTAEIESTLVEHEAVAEAAVVPIPDSVKGQGLYSFVTLVDDAEASLETKEELRALVKRDIGPIAYLSDIQFTRDLPKTRSGKIMRRILRKIAENDIQHLGDTSTLSNPDLVRKLYEERQTHDPIK